MHRKAVSGGNVFQFYPQAILHPIRVCCRNLEKFPDSSYYFGENSVIITVKLMAKTTTRRLKLKLTRYYLLNVLGTSQTPFKTLNFKTFDVAFSPSAFLLNDKKLITKTHTKTSGLKTEAVTSL